jgi:hypothetical protein
MSKILIPAARAEDWRQLLADPDKHWRRGYSARTLAHCWQEADGIPHDVLDVLSQAESLEGLETIFAIPEHQVPLPGGVRPSQNDVWVLARTPKSLVSIAVEGKVSESFGPTITEWHTGSAGKQRRLAFLCEQLGLPVPPPGHLRYQLFHRTASAIIEARRLHADQAAMVVHSFSPAQEGFQDYRNFLELFGLDGKLDGLCSTTLASGVVLHLAWIRGDQRYLTR